MLSICSPGAVKRFGDRHSWRRHLLPSLKSHHGQLSTYHLSYHLYQHTYCILYTTQGTHSKHRGIYAQYWTLFLSFKSHILDSNEVWCSWFWLEGSMSPKTFKGAATRLWDELGRWLKTWIWSESKIWKNGTTVIQNFPFKSVQFEWFWN